MTNLFWKVRAMEYINGKCPQCNGNLQIDNSLDTVVCTHCESKIIVQDAIWMIEAEAAANAENYMAAYETYTKVFKSNPNHWLAQFRRGIYKEGKPDGSQPLFSNVLQAITDAQNTIKQLGLPDDVRTKANRYFAVTASEIAWGIFNLAKYYLDEELQGRPYQGINFVFENFKDVTEFCSEVIKLIDGYTDDESKMIRLNLQRVIVYSSALLCRAYVMQSYDLQISVVGYPLSWKEEYFDKFDQALYEVRKLDSKFEQSIFLDRLEPDNRYDQSERDKINKNLQDQALAKIKQKELEIQKKKYREEHPEEYKALVDKVKRLERAMGEKNKTLDELTNKTIYKLQHERSELGVFSGKRKKELDDEISEKQKEESLLRNGINELDNELQALRKELKKTG